MLVVILQANNILAPSASAIDGAIERKIHRGEVFRARRMKIYMILLESQNYLKKSDALIDGASITVKDKIKQKKVDFLEFH